MKCENCGFLYTEGYEYPETYCAAGVGDDDIHFTGEGCTYHFKTLQKRKKEIDEAWDKTHEVTDEDVAYMLEGGDKCAGCKFNTHDYTCVPECSGCDGKSKFEPREMKNE